MPFAKPQLVNGAPRQPMPHGIFSVLAPRSPGDVHWQNGVEWESLTCGPVSGIGDLECVPDAPTQGAGLPLDFDPGEGLGTANPFVVYGSYSCSPVGRTLAEAQDRATEHLLAGEQAGVERQIWDQTVPNLTTGAETLGSGGQAPIAALALLEDFIASSYGSLGIIHASRGTASVLAQSGALVSSGAQLRTRVGTPVVAGGGYPPGTAVATPALFGYRSEIFTMSNRPGDLLDRRTNELYAVAERRYLVGWDDCGTAVVEVDPTCC